MCKPFDKMRLSDTSSPLYEKSGLVSKSRFPVKDFAICLAPEFY